MYILKMEIGQRYATIDQFVVTWKSSPQYELWPTNGLQLYFNTFSQH